MNTCTRFAAPGPGSGGSAGDAAQGSAEKWTAGKIGADMSVLKLMLIIGGLARIISLSLFQRLLLQVRPLQKV